MSFADPFFKKLHLHGAFYLFFLFLFSPFTFSPFRKAYLQKQEAFYRSILYNKGNKGHIHHRKKHIYKPFSTPPE